MNESQPTALLRRPTPTRRAWLRASRCLSIAAAPTFALMAALTATGGIDAGDSLCMAGTAPALGGMAPMYLLMSAFHAGPWLKLLSGRRIHRRRC